MHDKEVREILAQQTAILKQLAERGMDTKATPATIGTGFGIYQPGGIFSVAGTDRNIFTAHIRPTGIAPRLPLIPGTEDNPRFATITGITADSGSRAVNPCDDNEQAFLKGCYLTARYGRVARDTNTIEWDKVRRKVNRGVFDDLLLNGRLLGLSGLTPSNMTEDDILNVITKAEMVVATIAMERDLVTQMWQGSPAVATAGGGYIQFPGLDLQIATGQVDAETGVACPAVDSDVKDFGFDEVGGAGRDIVEYIQMMEWFLRFNARRMGLMPTDWVTVLRPELWEVLSEIWPCAYNTNRCADAIRGTGSRTFIDGRDNVRDRDQMRDNMSIDINGNRYDVIVDDGIFEADSTNNANLAAGQFASSFYFVPVSVLGGFPVTYREHVNYRLGAEDASLLRGTQDFWTDDGLYSWATESIKWCYKLSVKTEQRVVLRTPQLAGKIQSIMYSPLQHLRSPFPASPYHQDGGASSRATGSDYAVWLAAGQRAR